MSNSKSLRLANPPVDAFENEPAVIILVDVQVTN